MQDRPLVIPSEKYWHMILTRIQWICIQFESTNRLHTCPLCYVTYGHVEMHRNRKGLPHTAQRPQLQLFAESKLKPIPR